MLQKFKQYITKENMLVMVLVGIVLLIVVIPGGENKEKIRLREESATCEDTVQNETELYRKNLEKEVKDMLEKMEGAGKVEVMITLERSYETVEEGGNSFQTKNSGKTKVVKMPKVEGVLIVAQGALREQNNRLMSEAVMSLFHLDANKVKVVKMKGD